MYIEKWTKPIKHRRLHILKRSIDRKVWGIRYVIYNYLSRYNIIYKKHYYVDNVVAECVDLDHFGRVETKDYRVTLDCSFINTNHIREEYFYRKTKYGNKIVFTVSNEHYGTTKFYFRPIIVSVCLRDVRGEEHWYTTDASLNYTFKVVAYEPKITPSTLEPLEELKQNEKVFNLQRIRDLEVMIQVPVSNEELSTSQLTNIKMRAEEEIASALNEIPIGSLIC